MKKKIWETILELEKLDKQGESYTNSQGKFGWRNPIRSDTGPILTSLVMAKSPDNILELGTGYGLSTLYLLLGNYKNVSIKIATVEMDEKVAQITCDRFQKLSLPIEVYQGEISQVIERQLSLKFDLIFFDAQKDMYYKHLQELLEKDLIAKNCLIIADNVLDRSEEVKNFIDWFDQNKKDKCIIETTCGLMVATI